jgi:SAM-dependent methyltransferase
MTISLVSLRKETSVTLSGLDMFLSVKRTVTTSDEQLRRQLNWMKESWSWLMRTKVIEGISKEGRRPTALDVGCGPGLVMELFAPSFEVRGLDIDPEMVRKVKGRGFDAILGDVTDLPFGDDSFDVVYCSFTLLWVNDPQRAVREMSRVSRKSVVCLAEPDYGGRIVRPKEVADLDHYLTGSLVREGADPFIGRKLGGLMEVAGLEVEMGVHSGVWSPKQLRQEAGAEWDSIQRSVQETAGKDMVQRAKAAWDRALADGDLFLFNPVFYAVGRK